MAYIVSYNPAVEDCLWTELVRIFWFGWRFGERSEYFRKRISKMKGGGISHLPFLSTYCGVGEMDWEG